MKSTMKKLLLIAPFFLASILFGCKSPTDIDGNVIEVPNKTKPVEINDILVVARGGGRSVNQVQNRQPEFVDFIFDEITFDEFSVDTTSTNAIVLSFKARARQSVDNLNNFEGALPTEIEFEVDSAIITMANPASMPPNLIMKPIPIDRASMKAAIFIKKKVGGIDKIEKTEIEFPLNSSTNIANLLVSSFKFPGLSKKNKRKGLALEFNYSSYVDLDMDPDPKKDKTSIHGSINFEIEY